MSTILSKKRERDIGYEEEENGDDEVVAMKKNKVEEEEEDKSYNGDISMEDATDNTDTTGDQSEKKGFICFYCKKEFTRLTRLKEHERIHTGERPFVCDVNGCEKSFIRSHHLKFHKDCLHNDNPPSFPCTFEGCTSSFRVRQQLLKHIQIKHEGDGKPYKCSHEGCTESYHKQNQLARHIDMVHLHRFHYACTHGTCDKRFEFPGQLKNHVNKLHTGIKTFICSEGDCKESFFTFYEMTRHRKSCHRIFKCDVAGCDKSFNQLSILKGHKKTHESHEENRHYCTYPGCTKSYFEKKNLLFHIQTFHEKKVKFVCQKPCKLKIEDKPKKLVTKLTNKPKKEKVQKKQEEKEREEEDSTGLVNICGKEFTTQYNLNRHILSVHKTDEVIILSKVKQSILNEKKEKDDYHRKLLKQFLPPTPNLNPINELDIF